MPSQSALRTINAAITLSTALAGNAPAFTGEVIDREEAVAIVPDLPRLDKTLHVSIEQLRSGGNLPSRLQRVWKEIGVEPPERFFERRQELGAESRRFGSFGVRPNDSVVLVASSRPGRFSFLSTDGGATFRWLGRRPQPPAPIDIRPGYLVEKERRDRAVDALPATGVLTGYTSLLEHFRVAGELRFSSWNWYGGKKLPISKDPATRIQGTWAPIQGSKNAGGYRSTSWGTPSTWYLVEGANHYVREGWFTWL
ncbi:hypothetical protein [Nocardia sp. NPDC057227]|uniref:hypothetical protein n=1 Tax=Nocardia sp. NPDC057227 TaxID=3346056 RepID=UPI00362B388B